MAAPKTRILDVRLPFARGEEPFPLIRAGVDQLVAGQDLTVIAPFLPAPLIELLKGEGFGVAMERLADGAWSVNFRRE